MQKDKYKGNPTVENWLFQKDYPKYDPLGSARVYFDQYAKPCPLCGNRVKLVSQNECHGYGEFYDIWYIRCENCRLSKMLFTPLGEHVNIEKHVQFWNTRFDG